MDEFFLDIPSAQTSARGTEAMAMRLKNEVYGSTGLLCSVGGIVLEDLSQAGLRFAQTQRTYLYFR